MKKRAASLVIAACCFVAAAAAHAAATVGQLAPAFHAQDVNGKPVALGDFKGRYVVLEWNNPNCPFVQKHYNSGNMQTLQKRFVADDVAWLSINSTKNTHPDYMPPDQLAVWFRQENAAPTAILMDTSGEIGRAYGAKVTPHMYVIDAKGTLIYAGAIDDRRSASPADVKVASNYVAAALTDARSGKVVTAATSSAYGCSIKY